MKIEFSTFSCFTKLSKHLVLPFRKSCKKILKGFLLLITFGYEILIKTKHDEKKS